MVAAQILQGLIKKVYSTVLLIFPFGTLVSSFGHSHHMLRVRCYATNTFEISLHIQLLSVSKVSLPRL